MNFKEAFKKWWWVGLIVLVAVGRMLPGDNGNGKKKSKNRYSSSNEKYYKWGCKYCGKQIPIDEVLSPNEGVYTAENGFAFCSQDCWHAFQNLGH